MNHALIQRMQMIGQIFGVFLKIGPSTFGGGYAMIATIEKEVVDRKGWLDSEEIGDMVSIAGSAPGGVAVNSAAFIGYRLAGVAGAVAAVTAITLPTFVIVFLLSLLSTFFKDHAKVQAALKGIHAAVVALIILAAAKMWRTSILDATTLLIAAAAVGLLLFTGIHSLYLIVGGPIVGVLMVMIKRKCGITVRTERAATKEKHELHFPEYYI